MEEYEKTVLQLFAKAIKMAIEERKTNISQLSIKSGVSRSNIYKILNGQNYEIIPLIKIMRILQIHLEFSLMSADNNIHTMGGGKPNYN